MVAIVQTDIIRRLLRLFEQLDVEQALTFFTPDALYRFGNYPPAIGKEAIAAATKASHLEQIKQISFEINQIWEIKDTVICQLEINYIRNDNTVLTLPCTDIFRLEDDLVREMRVYMDASPLFAGSQPQQSTSHQVSEQTAELVKRLFAAVESNNVDEYVTYFTPDAIYKISNADPVIGPQGIREFALPVMQMFKSVSHNIIQMWELEETIICEMEVIYIRNDDKVFKLPCLDIIRLRGDKIQELQAFIDASPAFA